MAMQPIDIRTIRFEAKDAEIFNIPETKTRLDTLQNYFFPRLEVLLRDTADLLQDIYGVNPYEQMTVTARPRHRKAARQTIDSGEVYLGLTGRRAGRPLTVRRRDGVPFSYHPSRLTYTVYPEGEIQVVFRPFMSHVNDHYLAAVAALVRDYCTALEPPLAIYHIAPICVGEGVFVGLSEAFGPSAITDVTPTYRLALASPACHFPLDAPQLTWLEGAFIVLYPLLEACTAMAEGQSHQLPERLDTFKQWYRQALAQEGTEDAVERATIASSEPLLPDLDSYAFIRAGLWWAVLARDRWTCCSCGRSTRHDGVLLEVDHIMPRSQGGSNTMENLQTLCRKCNQGKSNRDSTDLRWAMGQRIQGEEER